jgi:multicomponent K+:H+ antiporter subunit D
VADGWRHGDHGVWRRGHAGLAAPGHLAGFAAILSSGTLLAAAGFGQNLLTAGLLYYLPSSTLAVSALFLTHLT